MKRELTILFTLIALFVIGTVIGCSTFKNLSCISKKTIPVTFVTKSGKTFTLQIPYCDTVQLTKETLPDSIQATTVITLKAKQ